MLRFHFLLPLVILQSIWTIPIYPNASSNLTNTHSIINRSGKQTLLISDMENYSLIISQQSHSSSVPPPEADEMLQIGMALSSQNLSMVGVGDCGDTHVTCPDGKTCCPADYTCCPSLTPNSLMKCCPAGLDVSKSSYNNGFV